MPIICPNLLTIILCLLWVCGLVFVHPCYAFPEYFGSKIFQGQQLKDGGFGLSSENYVFVLDFFSLGTSGNRYLGIWLNQSAVVNRDGIYREDPPRIVWVANRNKPINDASGVLMINATTGTLNLIYSGGSMILSTTTLTGNLVVNSSAELQNDGNLVLRQLSPDNYPTDNILWQSFDYPTDTLLPGMKLGINLKTGHEWSLTSWLSDFVPSSGSFSLGMNKNNTSLIISWHKSIYWNSGQWHNEVFQNLESQHIGLWSSSFEFISNDNEEYYRYSVVGQSLHRGIYLTPDGIVSDLTGNILANCDVHLQTELPTDTGCVNNSYPLCTESTNVFDRKSLITNKIVQTASVVDYNSSLGIGDCVGRCKQNCSCYACDTLHQNRTGCLFWGKNEMKFLKYGTGDDHRLIYVCSIHSFDASTRRWRRWWIWLITAGCGTLLLVLSILCLRRCCRVTAKRRHEDTWMQELVDASAPSPGCCMAAHDFSNKSKDKKMSEVRLFTFEVIHFATDTFSAENKLGEGGFGSVYKGKLPDGQEIAVKRLARSSNQGLIEFKNEIQLIVKLQHRNLVKLLGCCIHKEEMMLVYEYMPNKSLDFFLFDQTKREMLSWRNRMNIIEGIAQGLLYLHEYSRLTVIHRDMKAANILLDHNMAPKISDFGLAKIFELQNSETNTKRIVGTYGYICPHYAINGVISTKTDVFSFGVLVLEIVSGKRNRSSYHSERQLNLIGLAWELWIEARVLDLVDGTMDVVDRINEVKRCINIGLLCVQDSPLDRPSMKNVVFMLKNESLQLPTPKQPTYFIGTSTDDKGGEEDLNKNCSNKLSTSIMEAR